MCGVFGLTHAENAASATYLGLFALQHRGQESAGITVVDPDGKLDTLKGNGLVAEVFRTQEIERLRGTAAIGHVRYSTAGGGGDVNIQPLTARIAGNPLALAHNGNIVNATHLRDQLEDLGTILHSTSDTEIALHLMARCQKADITSRFLSAMQQIEGAFTSLLLTAKQMIAYVDRLGYRPLVLGRFKDGWVFASETCALDLIEAQFVRDVLPGELITVDLATQELRSFQSGQKAPGTDPSLVLPHAENRARCVFEHIYFGRPDSRLWGHASLIKREQLGEALASEWPAQADVVVPIPDSGVPIATGFARASDLPYRMGLIRNHYVGRTFIQPGQIVRNIRVRMKLNPVRDVVANKRVVVVDDSIVRGTTSRRIIEILRDYGAKEVHVRIGSPRVRFPCFYGIDTPKRRDLLAQTMTVSEMRDYLGADSLGFLSEQALVEVMNRDLESFGSSTEWCTSCFSGDYQDEFAQQAVALEPRSG